MRIAVTGGTGSLGTALARRLLSIGVERLALISRDEVKQRARQEEFGEDAPVRFILADVRDRDRMRYALQGCEAVVHAAALKRIDRGACEVWEHVRTNLLGTRATLEAALDAGVGRFLLISSDKSCDPRNAYGGTKFLAELVTTEFNVYAWPRGMRCSSVRWGNVWRSRGSVAEVWDQALRAGDPIPLTDPDMTRFLISLGGAAQFALHALARMQGGEVFVPDLRAVRMGDLAEAMAPGHPVKVTGWRDGGEKLAERLVGPEEARRTLLAGDGYLIKPSVRSWSSEPYHGAPVADGFRYESDMPERRMTLEEVRGWLTACS